MNKIFMSCVIGLTALVVQPAFASTWNIVLVGNRDMEFYFDADTIEKSSGVVTAWIKTVQTQEINEDGSWAMAMRWRMNCAKKTIQILSSSQYDVKGKFISSSSAISREEAVIPDSSGETILKLACMKNFPNAKNSFYYKVENNDIYQDAKQRADYAKTHTDLAPQ